MPSDRARAKEIPGLLVKPAMSRRENMLLAALPASELQRLVARCEPVELAVDDVLCEQGKPLSHVYFPITSQANAQSLPVCGCEPAYATAACSRFHVLRARLARCLLMTRDRANSNDFYLTHEVAAYMLGVRREGVTEAASFLQARRVIRYRRGQVTIVNAPALEAATCNCYAAMALVYAQIMS